MYDVDGNNDISKAVWRDVVLHEFLGTAVAPRYVSVIWHLKCHGCKNPKKLNFQETKILSD